MKRLKQNTIPLPSSHDGILKNDEFQKYIMFEYKNHKMYYMWHSKPASITLNMEPIIHTTWECDTYTDNNDKEDFEKIIKELEDVYFDFSNRDYAKDKIVIINIHRIFIYEDRYYMKIAPKLIDKIKEKK